MSSIEPISAAAGAQTALPPWRRFTRFIKFAIVGGSGVLVNMGVFNLAYHSFLSSLSDDVRLGAANVLGVIVSIFSNFLLNDGWTWGDRAKGGAKSWFKRLGKYYLVCSVAALVQLGVAQLSFKYVFGPWAPTVLGFALAPSLAVGVGIIAGIAINFPVSHLWAFKDESDGNATHVDV